MDIKRKLLIVLIGIILSYFIAIIGNTIYYKEYTTPEEVYIEKDSDELIEFSEK